jgi:hypothetical protein
MNKGEVYDVHLMDGTILHNLIFDRVSEYYLLWEGDIMTLYREIKYIKQL